MPAVRFTKADITRAVNAARTAGLSIDGIEIHPDGTIRILCPTIENELTAPAASGQAELPKQWT